jgi:DcuC family C4-dicarboxylate transporter
VTLFLAALIIAGAVILMVRRVEVRLVLFGAGLLMATIAGTPLVVFDSFTRASVATMVAPICAAMGFARVLGVTGCDRHLALLLLTPIRRVPWLLVPGSILAAYLVNLAVPSQTSTAAALGPVLMPLMAAAGIGLEIGGAALVLGASFGGDLLHPAAQDVVVLSGSTGIDARAISGRVIPASLTGVVVAAVVFTLLQRQGPGKEGKRTPGVSEQTHDLPAESEATEDSPLLGPPVAAETRPQLVKALIPLVPIGLLLLAYAGWPPLAWLRRSPEGEEWEPLQNALPVVRAMLLGTLLAVAVCWREVQRVTRGFFDGMGLAYGSIISLTITAQCFSAGIGALGVSKALLGLVGGAPGALAGLAAGFPWALAALGGSGSGAIVTFGETFLEPVAGRPDAAMLAALSCLAGAFGRTMSPVAAVVVYTSGLVGVSPILIVRRLLPALLAGAGIALAIVLLNR